MNETHQDNQQADIAIEHEERRLRRVPSVLPIGMQNQLHRRQSSLRAAIEKVIRSKYSLKFLLLCLKMHGRIFFRKD